MFREKCQVIENKEVTDGYFVIKFRSPRISATARPGQFVQILCLSAGKQTQNVFDPLLPRPFSFLTASKTDFSFLYHVIGKGTILLSSAKPGDALWILGPLGNGFTIGSSLRGGRDSDRRSNLKIASLPLVARNDMRLLVGGGVGIPPLLHLAEFLIKQKKSFQKNIHVFLGARKKNLLLCEKDFKKLGVSLSLATDDGSKGKKGFVTQLLSDFLSTLDSRLSTIYTCGPTPMLKAVSTIAIKHKIPCEVSVEVPMACGFGVCLGCAIKTRRQKAEDGGQNSDLCSLTSDICYSIACTEGPVFQAKDIEWNP